ncbi:hypothetical protein MHYP_G00175340 [Metynnis hypsauchen]
MYGFIFKLEFELEQESLRVSHLSLVRSSCYPPVERLNRSSCKAGSTRPVCALNALWTYTGQYVRRNSLGNEPEQLGKFVKKASLPHGCLKLAARLKQPCALCCHWSRYHGDKESKAAIGRRGCVTTAVGNSNKGSKRRLESRARVPAAALSGSGEFGLLR